MNNRKTMISVICALMIALAILGLIIVGLQITKRAVSKNEMDKPQNTEPVVINLNKYTEITLKGGNGWATAYGDINWGRIAEDYDGQIHAKPGTWYMFPDTSLENDLRSSVFIEFDKDMDLQNGDVIHYKYHILQSGLMNVENVEYIFEDGTYEVSGLVEPEPFDPFDGLEITFEGKSGQGKAIFKYKGEEEFINNYQYYTQNNGVLSNGDTITVHYENTYYDLVNFNKKAPATDYEVIVGGLEEN